MQKYNFFLEGRKLGKDKKTDETVRSDFIKTHTAVSSVQQNMSSTNYLASSSITFMIC